MKYFGFIGFLFAGAAVVAAIKGDGPTALLLVIIALAFIAFGRR